MIYFILNQILYRGQNRHSLKLEKKLEIASYKEGMFSFVFVFFFLCKKSLKQIKNVKFQEKVFLILSCQNLEGKENNKISLLHKLTQE